MNEAQKYLDYVMLMTYDFRGGFQILTGHHTNLGPTSGDIFPSSTMNSVKLFEDAGVPSEKLLIGSAFYSRSWTGVPNVNNGYLQMAKSTGGISQDFTDLDRDYINKNGYIRYGMMKQRLLTYLMVIILFPMMMKNLFLINQNMLRIIT